MSSPLATPAAATPSVAVEQPGRIPERGERRAPRDRVCARCGYGVAVDPPPASCPMCGATAWVLLPPA